MDSKVTAFYKENRSIEVDFSGEKISSDGSLVLLEKIERKEKLIHYFSSRIPEYRSGFVHHSVEKMLKQRIYSLMLGYEDVNDVDYLKEDPIFQEVLSGDLASQPTISRFENSFNKQRIFDLCNAFVDRYVSSLKGRKSITIDIDGTDDPTHGKQQLSLFNGFYGQKMYNQLYLHDGETGQIILPVLRPGNSHSNRWYVAILKRIIKKIRKVYPEMEITIRGDAGFSCASFYQLAEEKKLLFVLGVASNAVLKRKVLEEVNSVKAQYVEEKEKHQSFKDHYYGAESWGMTHRCISKIESTGKGLNVRHIITNLTIQNPEEVYFGVYVRRGETSENRIKEVKNMCFSDRLSNHGFWANFARLLFSAITYEFNVLIKNRIQKTAFEEAKKWCVNSIRSKLLKVGATLRRTKKRLYFRLSSAFCQQKLFIELLRME